MLSYQGHINKQKVDRYINLICHIIAYQQTVIFYYARNDTIAQLTFILAITHMVLSLLVIKCKYRG